MSQDFPSMSVSNQARAKRPRPTFAGSRKWRFCAMASHIGIVGSASALGRDPVDVPGGVFDVASFAMDAILSVDDKARLGPARLVRVNDLIDAGRAIEPRRLAVTGEIVADRDVRIAQPKVHGLVLLVIGVG